MARDAHQPCLRIAAVKVPRGRVKLRAPAENLPHAVILVENIAMSGAFRVPFPRDVAMHGETANYAGR